MTTGPDRLALLRGHATLNGIDRVAVSADHAVIEVHFLNPPSAALETALTSDRIRVVPDPADGAAPPPILTDDIAWLGAGDDRRLSIPFAGPGPFNPQRLVLDDPLMDAFFGSILFSFKAGCPSRFDCKTNPDCPEPERLQPVIDYTARDFDSYRQAILDYAATHWPDWRERHLPDVGNMLVDLMAHAGSELAYTQDRAALESSLATATQPRSRRAHARLMDYDPAPALAAHGLLDVQVGAGNGNLVAGGRVWAQTVEGVEIPFEIGLGLADPEAPQTWPVNAALDDVAPYLFDEDQFCLFAGSTGMAVEGHLAALLPAQDLLEDGRPARRALLRTDPENAVSEAASAAPEKRVPVWITDAQDDVDTLTGDAFTRLTFAAPLAQDLELETLTLHGNLVPISAGQTQEAITFVAGRRSDADPALPDPERAALAETIEREGPGDAVLHRLFLPGTEDWPLSWHATGGPETARPAIEITALSWDGATYQPEDEWTWRRSLLGAPSSLPDSSDFTLEDGRWDTIRRFDHLNDLFDWRDYHGPLGTTLRFGDGEFGREPPTGTLFRLRYRIGGGAATNLGADSITHIDPGAVLGGIEPAVANPFALSNGADAESEDDVRINAPQAWKAITFRAVRAEDYEEAAERLDWVDHARARTRWTGSWLSTFTTPDPADRFDLPVERRQELDIWLDRFRMAGRDSRVADPVYADLDFEITVCAATDRERSDVARRVQRRLSSRPGGFFDPNDRSFGQGVERSRLEAAIHGAGGVRAVERIRFRRRGWFAWRDLGPRYEPEGGAELIRVASDPARPERGSITLIMEGGS
ncbi:hypothetical protein [Chachezhania antarctica]|uniref:hypothetical protein n=1 Tax=Chachezhania antarctica TaxID=2340860 RepID=UPI000EAFDA91|nr:hypothetical protein [Chachezhania antarctica]